MGLWGRLDKPPGVSLIHGRTTCGDHELVEFFSSILENNLTATQRAKEMLLSRLQNK
jgi:hypothetical protein